MVRMVKVSFDHEVGPYFVLETNGKMSIHLKNAVVYLFGRTGLRKNMDNDMIIYQSTHVSRMIRALRIG